jgi:hypothetical protein
LFAINADDGSPSFNLLMKENALESRFVVSLGAAIVCVLGTGRRTKICPPVVGANAVDVINVMFGPPAGLHQIDHAMRTIEAIIKADKTLAATR